MADISRSAMAREALKVLGQTASNKAIREYVKEKYDVELKGNELWRIAGNQKDRTLKEVTYEELVNVNHDAKKYGSLARLSLAVQAAIIIDRKKAEPAEKGCLND
jgi:hypothetical protein